jgi:hypothetical protein
MAAVTLFGCTVAPHAYAQEEWQYGACGGVMTGYDRRPYTCGPDRKPACDRRSGRCVCLLRTECGAKQNEPY